MFQLDKHDSQFVNLNSRIERHGEDRVLAADLKFAASVGNATLDGIEKGLKEAFFRKPGKGEQQTLPNIGETLTAVKFPSIEPIRLSHEFTGYEVQIDGALESTEPVLLVDATIKKLTLDFKEGGSVELAFTVSANVDPDDLAELSEALIREDVRLTLTPPATQEGEQKEAA